jgi:lysophospholipase L1-like esterase
MPTNARVLSAAAVVVGIAVWILLRAGDPVAAPPTSGQGIVAFGDSLVEGRGAPPGQDFVSVLAARLGTSITNAGRSGDTTRAALQRLPHDVLALNPRIVIVLLGGNDYLRRVPTEETFANLETIVTRIRQQGAAVILAGVAVGLMSDPYAAEYDALARRTSSGLVSDILDGIQGRPGLMADAIHPNGQGYARIADRLEPVVRELMP